MVVWSYLLKKMKIDNQILINDYPINLFKLIDLINIQF